MTYEQASAAATAAINERLAAEGATKWSRADYEHHARAVERLLNMEPAEPDKTCNDCFGVGSLPGMEDVCPRCGGEGKVM